MQRQAEKDPAEEARKLGMTLSDTSYSIPGRGLVYVATDKPSSSFASIDDYVRYVHEHRHERDKVRFINIDKQNLYSATSEQDKIAQNIAKQEGVDVGPPPFQREARRAEMQRRREDTETVSVNYAGSAVRIEIDVSNMNQAEKDILHKDIERMGRRPGEDALFYFLEHHSDITNVTVVGSRRDIGLGDPRETLADINSIARRS